MQINSGKFNFYLLPSTIITLCICFQTPSSVIIILFITFWLFQSQCEERRTFQKYYYGCWHILQYLFLMYCKCFLMYAGRTESYSYVLFLLFLYNYVRYFYCFMRSVGWMICSGLCSSASCITVYYSFSNYL